MKQRIAWFSMLPGDEGANRSLSAWTSRLLLPILRHWFQIELFHDSFESFEDYETHHYLQAARRHAERPFDLFVYQLEDLPAAQFARVHCLLEPGLIWFHDYLFSSFGPEPILNSAWQQFMNAFHFEKPEFAVRGAEWKQKGPEAMREGAAAIAALFSNPAHADLFSSRAADAARCTSGNPPVSVLPVPVPGGEVYHESPSNGRIVYCGTTGIEHRPHKVLGALSQLRGMPTWTCSWLVDDSERSKAEAMVSSWGIADRVKVLPGRSPDRWQSLLAGADIALHPYFTVFGQPSPYLSLSIRRGVPVVTTAFAGPAHLPSDLVWKVQPGAHEAYQIRQIVQGLLGASTFPRARDLARFGTELFEPRCVASQLAAFIEQHSSGALEVTRRWHKFKGLAREALLAELEQVAPGAGTELNQVLTPEKNALASFLKELGLQTTTAAQEAA